MYLAKITKKIKDMVKFIQKCKKIGQWVGLGEMSLDISFKFPLDFNTQKFVLNLSTMKLR